MRNKASVLAAIVYFLTLTQNNASCEAAATASLEAAESYSQKAAKSSDLQEASKTAGLVLDNSASRTGFVSVPLIDAPAGRQRLEPVTANLVMGDPERADLREPKNPLEKDERPKAASSGHGMAWALGGALVLGGVGFFFAGPVGAAAGAFVGSLIGYFFGR
ncbi:MAG: hypothetical protein WCU88_07110 [Elusimicrobiota bacterium]|jgi:hypothetical protein